MSFPKSPIPGAFPGAIPGFDMGQKQHAPHALPFNGQHVGAIGLKGPWSLNPGSPDLPNHRPYLTNPKPPSAAPRALPQKLPDPNQFK